MTAVRTLAVLVLITAPVDTIDLAGGQLGFQFRPFFVLSLAYCVAGALTGSLLRGLAREAPGAVYLRYAALALTAFWMFVSVAFVERDPDGLAMPRAALSAWLVLFSVLFVISLADDVPSIFASGTKAFLLVDAGAVCVEALAHFGVLDVPPALAAYLRFAEGGDVGGVPRLSGLVDDPNRAAVSVVLLLAVNQVLASRRPGGPRLRAGYYLLGAGLTLVTVSRTGLVALAVLAVGALVRPSRLVEAGRVARACLMAAMCVTLALCVVSVTGLGANVLEALGERTMTALAYAPERQAATDEHLGLIAFGWHMLAASWKTIAVGYGWGTEYLYTTSILAGDKYGNFHSGYISMAVQTGLVGLGVYALAMLLPAARDVRWAGFTVIVLWANAFYQYHADAVYWLVLAVASAWAGRGSWRTRAATIPHEAVSRPGGIQDARSPGELMMARDPTRVRLLVDDRWSGPTGIGRFAREVLARRPETEVDLVVLGRHWALNHPLTPLYLGQAIRERQPHVFWSPGFMPPAFSRVPFLFTMHDLIHLRFATRAHAVYYNGVIRPLGRRAARILTVSEFSRGELVEWLGVPPEQVLVVGNGVSPAFRPEGRRHSIGRPYVLYVGNRRRHKNLDRLLRGFAAVRLPREIALAISGNQDAELARQAAALGIGDRVVFLGSIDEDRLPDVYRGALVVCCVSLYEGFGLPALEAMACGVPVLASDATSSPEIVGDAGLLVDPYNVDAIAYGLQRLVEDRGLVEALAGKGRVRATWFSWDRTAKLVYGAVREALA